MCTAVTCNSGGFYCGRTLDYEHDFGAEVAVMPRRYPLRFRAMGTLESHYAVIGMARVEDGYPLFFDGMNENGLAMAGLNFVGNARYGEPVAGRDNVAHYEIISWILAQCATVKEARALLSRLNLTGEAFCPALPPAQLHWLIADREESVTVESVAEGLRVYPNPVGVLTNNPPFPEQLRHLSGYGSLSPETPEGCERGMGALGLPGDLSSRSRFVRAAFVKQHSVSGPGEPEAVNQFFHILDAVAQPRGCCRVGEGEYEITQYTSCCSADRGIYYYRTYDSHRITGVALGRENLEGSSLIRYPLLREEKIFMQN